ncbi:hypothetical protein [Paenibacillus apiarius]|uniref:Molecular chaperone n=1 Tax=Paenibacillus apiarius TaxID=46240 RepID=A0ABT4DS54_9BACL|nr:hypothetical protein [Paenibacillus apiarius]MCY9517111.1 molecular chaperone [Paenibacillus apiarius]MCY9520192.1 molecular chaperone [Paenibacillus apiarius]MCY9554920.1 molecular chaperone [Paenibacillus apiarius]MCY9561431.1 molecular chaperone [Paenibacillus apiarius]MCY9685953.1 molecular chaperone [Paenibacillus apiarius]
MDKRTVIAAYQRGDITIHECAQIIGLEAPLQGWIPLMSSDMEDRVGMPPQSHTVASHSNSIFGEDGFRANWFLFQP